MRKRPKNNIIAFNIIYTYIMVDKTLTMITKYLFHQNILPMNNVIHENSNEAFSFKGYAHFTIFLYCNNFKAQQFSN